MGNNTSKTYVHVHSLLLHYKFTAPTFALTFSNDAGLTNEKHIKNTSCGERKLT